MTPSPDPLPTQIEPTPPPSVKLSHGMTPAGIEARAAVLRRHGWTCIPPGLPWYRRVWAAL